MELTIPGSDAALLELARAVQATDYRFITPTPATIARVRARPDCVWARDLRDVFGWSLPFRPGVVPPGILASMSDAGVLLPHGDGHRSAVRLSMLEGLLFLHSAYPTDAADSVFFGPDTYRFARAILGHRVTRPVHRAIDIGTGAGPGAILLARAHPSAEVFAGDINDQALRITRANAALAGVRVVAAESDLLSGVPGDFDLIVSNPPYLVDPTTRAYRHGGGPLGADLSLAILDAALDRLAPGGTLLLYTGAAIVNGADPFQDAATVRCASSGVAWAYAEIDPDVFGEELETDPYTVADRIAAVLLTVTKMESHHA